MNVRILQGDCLELLPTLPENSIDACVTDPPYGLEFMGKAWDHGVPGVELWREVFRVLKPGAHLLAFGGTRTYHRMVCAIENAGFEIRDQIQWIYGSGFPKSHNMKDEWQGWGTALKPAHEPIVLARKPLSEKTVAANVLKWGTGGLNIDGCRVGTEQRFNPSAANKAGGNSLNMSVVGMPNADGRKAIGRFPANVIHDGSDEVLTLFPDSQAGTDKGKRGTGGIWSPSSGIPCGPQYGDSGSAARFFYCAKSSRKERNGSKHPTVKPVALMRYLCRLVTPLGGTVLDPFAGTGTTGEAAVLEGFGVVLIEREAEYIADIERRIACEDKEEEQQKTKTKTTKRTNSTSPNLTEFL